MAKSDNGELNNSNLASLNSDPNNSLLQKVTKRVSGLFPSSITKWFGPPSDGVIRRRDSEDDDDEQLQIQQPPKKRAKPSIITSLELEPNYQMTSTPLMNSRHLQAGPSGYTRHTITSNLYDGPSTSGPILNGGGGDDNKSDDSGESTSGYSSVLVQQNKERGFVSDRAKSQPTRQESTTPSPNKSLNTSRSLFSDQSLNPQRQCLSARRPSFNSSTFGSPTFMDRTLSTKRAVNSPFYGGRTIYGGASAYKRNRIIFPRDEQKKSVSIKPVDLTCNSENVSLSKTARRILDTLEHFSTPVIDAKKIPPINRRVTPYSRDEIKPPPAPSKRELIIPTVPDLLKMKQKERLQESTEQVRKLATTSKSILNCEYSIPNMEQKTKKLTTKIKTKINPARAGGGGKHEDVIDAVKLPEVKLPITNLPKFDFTLPPPVPPQKQPPPLITSSYKFAAPIVLCEKPPLNTVKSLNHFKFNEPINAKHQFKAESSTAPRKKNNGQNNDVFIKPSPKLIEGSVSDILRPPSDNLTAFKPDPKTWECAICMVRNIPAAIRCVACETLKNPPKPNNFGDKFKMSAEKWECSACMVRNNMTDVKCVACTTSRIPPAAPIILPSSSSGLDKISGGFGDKFKPAQDSWECGACLIRNKSGTIKCAACETPKPGSKPTKPSIENKSEFTDLIRKQQTNWECPSCMVRNPPEKKQCACCEGPKPGEKQEFKFGAPTQFKFGLDKAETSGFSFGVSAAQTPPTFSFGIPPPPPQTSEPPQKFSFGILPPEAAPPIILNGEPKKFGTQSTTITSSTNSATKTTSIFNPVTATVTTPIKTSESSNNGVSSTSITTTTIASSTFSFGAAAAANQKTNDPPPQFNFGSGSLPFNPVFGSNIPKSQQQNEFSFNKTPTTTTNNNNVSEVKPTTFSFANPPKTETKTTKFPEFTFNPLTTTAPPSILGGNAPKVAPVMTTAAAAPPPPTTSLFSFGVQAKTETKTTTPTPNFGSMFGASSPQVVTATQPPPTQPLPPPQVPPQNGGFNFGATAVTPNFNFGGLGAPATASSTTTPTAFGFGISQAGSGSATAPSAPGVFTFGGGAPAQQPTTAAFTPDIKPNFNFTGGTQVASFTAQGGPSATMPQRKIRKAVRRTQPR